MQRSERHDWILETHARAGQLPPPEDNGLSCLRIPLNALLAGPQPA